MTAVETKQLVDPPSIPAPARPRRGQRLARLRRTVSALALPLAVYAASRAFVMLAVATGVAIDGEIAILRSLGSWDGFWYESIARDGYPRTIPAGGGEAVFSEIAFFPLFPLVARAVALATGMSPLAACVAVATAAGALATALVWLLVRHLTDVPTADRAAAVVCLFPGSFVLSMAYAEGLLLALAAACLLALLHHRWLIAGVLAALATATRPNAVALCVCCLVAAVVAYREDGDRSAFVAPTLSGLGAVAFFAYLWAWTGEPLAWFRVEREAWNEFFDLGLGSVLRIGRAVVDPLGDVRAVVATLGTAFGLVALHLLWRWRPPLVVRVYAVTTLALALMSNTLGGRPRFVLAAFPLVVAVAVHVRGRQYAWLLAGSAVVLAALAAVSTVTEVVTP